MGGGSNFKQHDLHVYFQPHLCASHASHFAVLGPLPRLLFYPCFFLLIPHSCRLPFIIQFHSTWYSLSPLLDSKIYESKLSGSLLCTQCSAWHKAGIKVFVAGKIAHFTFLDMCKVQWGHKVSGQLSQGRLKNGISGTVTFDLMKGQQEFFSHQEQKIPKRTAPAKNRGTKYGSENF